MLSIESVQVMRSGGSNAPGFKSERNVDVLRLSAYELTGFISHTCRKIYEWHAALWNTDLIRYSC